MEVKKLIKEALIRACLWRNQNIIKNNQKVNNKKSEYQKNINDF